MIPATLQELRCLTTSRFKALFQPLVKLVKDGNAILSKKVTGLEVSYIFDYTNADTIYSEVFCFTHKYSVTMEEFGAVQLYKLDSISYEKNTYSDINDYSYKQLLYQYIDNDVLEEFLSFVNKHAVRII